MRDQTPFRRGPVTVGLVRDENGFAKVRMVRAVYIANQDCPYLEEMDGNDFCASHILAEVDGNPAGTIRLRWFAGFCKVERITVIPRFEGPQYGVVRAMAEFGLPIIAAKGYTRIVTHAQERLAGAWRRVFRFLQPTGQTFAMSDHGYVVLAGDLRLEVPVIGEATDPLVMNRPEGAWDRPGVLDASAERPATNIHRRRSGD